MQNLRIYLIFSFCKSNPSKLIEETIGGHCRLTALLQDIGWHLLADKESSKEIQSTLCPIASLHVKVWSILKPFKKEKNYNSNPHYAQECKRSHRRGANCLAICIRTHTICVFYFLSSVTLKLWCFCVVGLFVMGDAIEDTL